jgi:hypothetical protein
MMKTQINVRIELSDPLNLQIESKSTRVIAEIGDVHESSGVGEPSGR